MATARKLKLGQTVNQVTTVLDPIFIASSGEVRSTNYPFSDLLPAAEGKTIIEFESRAQESDAKHSVLFLYFHDVAKTKLVDALIFKDGIVSPVVEGAYCKNLRALRVGDSVETLYRTCGRRDCEYTKGRFGKWVVRFLYMGYEEEMYLVEAEARQGRIIYSKRCDL